MSYFCSVKSLIYIKSLLTTTFMLLTCININAQQNTERKVADDIEISLLTCSPHDEIYSLYGHTAIRFQDKSEGIDYAINYGVFSFQKPFFILRFVFGITDYEMGIVPFQDFCQEYLYYGAQVVQQDLNLSSEEKLNIAKALQNNYKPQNRVYRYNYFYNNCTTKARDIILENIKGKVVFKNEVNEGQSFRDMIHSCNENYRWARFGNDILLGARADFKTSRSEQQFLPEKLETDFNAADVITADGRSYPLVKRSVVVIPSEVKGITNKRFCPTPRQCAWALFLILTITSFAGIILKKKMLYVDFTIMLISGLLGIVLFAMLFSEHPTTSTNIQILVLNPASLFGCYYIIKNRRNESVLKRVWIVCAVILTLFIFCGFFQSYAEGISILALSLLIRTICNLINTEKEKDTNED